MSYPSGSSVKATDNRTRLPQNQPWEGVKCWWKMTGVIPAALSRPWASLDHSWSVTWLAKPL